MFLRQERGDCSSGRPASGAALNVITPDTPVTRCATTRTACARLTRWALKEKRHLPRSVKHNVLRALLAPPHSAGLTTQRTKAKPIECSPGVNAVRYNITSVMQNALVSKAANPRALRATHVMSGAPGLPLVAARIVYAGATRSPCTPSCAVARAAPPRCV